MKTPLTLIFDLSPDRDPRPHEAALPRINQGAPYRQRIWVKEDNVFRDFSGFEEIEMQFRTSQNAAPFLTLSRSSGEIVAHSDGLTIRIAADRTNDIKIPITNVDIANQLRFLHSIVLTKGGNVQERFAEGYGYIVAAITR